MTTLLRAKDAAEIVGYTESTINRWCRTGKLPATKHGHHYFIRASDLEAMFDPFSPAAGSNRSAGGDGGSFPTVPVAGGSR